MGFDNVCLQRRDLRGLAMHHCDTDSNAWFHCMPFEVDLWQEPNREKNGTSIVRCWDVRAAAYSLCMRVPSSVIHHRDPSGLCFENVCLSNTFDSPALNHLLTVFTSWSFLFYNSQLLLYKDGKELQVHKGARRTVCKLDFCFLYLSRKTNWLLITACRLGWRRVRN